MEELNVSIRQLELLTCLINAYINGEQVKITLDNDHFYEGRIEMIVPNPGSRITMKDIRGDEGMFGGHDKTLQAETIIQLAYVKARYGLEEKVERRIRLGNVKDLYVIATR